MNYLYIKYKYGKFKERGPIDNDIREIISYKFSNNKEELGLKSDPGSSPYANWIDNSDDSYIKFSLYVDIKQFNITKSEGRLDWINKMIKQCRRSENLKKLIS